MAIFGIPISHVGGGIPEDEKVLYDSIQNHGFSNRDGMGLILKDDAGVKVLKAQVPILVGGLTISAVSLEIRCSVNSTATTDIAFYFRYINVASTEGGDQGTLQQTVTDINVAGSGTVLDVLAKSETLTSGNFADEDICQYEFGMDGANNDMGENIIVHSAWLKITAS